MTCILLMYPSLSFPLFLSSSPPFFLSSFLLFSFPLSFPVLSLSWLFSFGSLLVLLLFPFSLPVFLGSLFLPLSLSLFLLSLLLCSSYCDSTCELEALCLQWQELEYMIVLLSLIAGL